MTTARKHLVCLSETPYYLVSSRCVRRAYLCGLDKYTGRSYEHRRLWIEDRIRVLASLFGIEVCAYAIMSNHYHLVVKLVPDEIDAWTDDDVLDRWTALFRGPLLVRRYRAGKSLTDIERSTLRSIVAVYRRRLKSLSWFMKCLNEPIARKANAEDSCTGHFWEARFHSQALGSDRAVLAAMAYVDLNPIRAGLASTPETSAYTSIRSRIESGPRNELAGAVARLIRTGELNHWHTVLRPLMRFAGPDTPGESSGRPKDTLPFSEAEYLKLVDTTGRVIVQGKRGRIDPALEPIFERLGLAKRQWISASSDFRRYCRKGDLKLEQPA